MLGNVKVSTVPRYPGARHAWNFPRAAAVPFHKSTPAQKIETRIGQAFDPSADGWKPEFPFPLEGPLMPAPADKEASRILYQRVKRALGLTTGDLAAYFGLKARTLQKWEQGRFLIDSTAWTLIQIVIRNPEARRLLTLKAQGEGA